MTTADNPSPKAPTSDTPRRAHVATGVTYTAGDGPALAVPSGPVELQLAPDSATLSWTASNGSAGSAALPRAQYEQYVRDGKIRPG